MIKKSAAQLDREITAALQNKPARLSKAVRAKLGIALRRAIKNEKILAGSHRVMTTSARAKQQSRRPDSTGALPRKRGTMVLKSSRSSTAPRTSTRARWCAGTKSIEKSCALRSAGRALITCQIPRTLPKQRR